MTDRYTFIAPAKVKCLLVPINGCTQSSFEKFLHIIKTNVSEVRLLEIAPNSTLHYFNPQTFPNGRIIYDFVTTSPDGESIFLHDFEPFRKTFIIVGVGKYDPTVDTTEVLTNLKKHYPSSIVHNAILFDSSDDKRSTNHPHGVYFHDGSIDKNVTQVETIFSDISGNFLAALDSYASSYSNITLRSPVSITDSHTLTKTINQAQKRLSSGSTSFKASFSSANTASPSTSDAKSKTQQRHNGRQSKLMGNLYLLAGRYNQALQSFTESLTNLKKCDDFLWLGNALEGIGISTLLLQYVGQAYQLPSQTIFSVLQISKSKLHSMTTVTSSSNSGIASPNRTSADHFASPSQSTVTTSNGHLARPSPSTNSTHSPRNSTSSGTFNFSSSPDLSALPLPVFIKLITSKVLHFYNLSTNDYENMVPDIVYVESILRTIKYMIGVHLSGSELDSGVLDHIVKSKKLSANVTENGHFSKVDILREIENVFSLQLVDMSITEQCRIYCCLASMYTDLQLYRKRAFILRTLLVGILPKLETSLARQRNDDLEIFNSMTYLTRSKDRASSIKDIFEYLFSIYNVNSQPESNAESAYNHSQGNWTSLQISLIKLTMRICEAVKDWSFMLKLCGLLLTRFTHCLPPDDQIKLKEKIDNLIYLSNRNNLNLSTPYWDPYLVRRVKFVSSRHKDELVSFSEYEQNNPSAGLDSAKSTTSATSSEPVIFNPYNKSKTSTINRDKLLIKDDIYQLKVQLQNPFAFEVEVNDIVIVTDGEVQVQTLKNQIRPLGQVTTLVAPNNSFKAGMFNSKIRVNAQVIAKKVTFPASPSIPAISSSQGGNGSLIIPPNSSEHFSVTFKPLNDGDLKVVGFYICLGNCEEQYFKIIDKEILKQNVKVQCPANDILEEKESTTEKCVDGIDQVYNNLLDNNVLSRASTKTLSLTVIPPQPSLSLTNISITNGWIMLLEGEKIKFSISLTNHSNELINYLSFSFWDSTIEALNKKLNSNVGNQVIPASEVYEIEWYLLKFKPFKILNKELISEKYEKILPRSDITIDYEITAKRGIRESKIILEYAHKQQDLSKSFVKYVQVPLNLSIMPSLEIVGCDILPLFSSSLQGFEGTQGELVNGNLDKVLKFITDIIESDDKDIADYCLLVIDLRNSWNEKLTSFLENAVDSNESFAVEDHIEPGKTNRFLLPMKRISNQDSELTRPIPSLRNKQFIKNYAVSEAEELKIRELFWLRNILLENLQGTWKTVHVKDSDSRHGNIELRNIRLTSKMANILIYNPIRLTSEIYLDSEPSEPVKKVGTEFNLKVDEFYFLRTTVSNVSNTTIKGILRHLPFPLSSLSSLSTNNPNYAQMSIDRKILINGVLQNPLGERGLEPGGRMHLDLSLVILEKGEYEWGCVLDILNKDNVQVVEREPLYINAS